MTTFLTRGVSALKPSAPASSTEEAAVNQPWNKHARLASLLLSIVSYSDEIDTLLREEAIVELVILAHHPLICPYVSLFSRRDLYAYQLIPSVCSRWDWPTDLDRVVSKSGGGSQGGGG